MDESEGDAAFIAAGWACRAERWDCISEGWQAVLNTPPSIKYFKLNEAMGRKKQFHGWKEKNRDDKVQALARSLPHEAGFYAHGCYVSREDFRAIKEKVQRIYRSPYFFCVAVAMVTSVSGANQIIGPDKIDFVLDRSADAIRMRKLFYDEIKPRFPRLGECVDLDDKETNPLQAADLCAGFLRQFHEPNPRSMPGTREMDGISALTTELTPRVLRDIISTPLFKKKRASPKGV